MRYPYLFLDCDGTLFDFDQSERNAIKFLSGQIGFDYEKGMSVYHEVNAQCWAELEQGLMDQEQLRVERFRRFLPLVGCKADPEKANEIYGDALAKEGIPYPFTKPLLTRLRSLGYKLYITTNGIPATQWGRYHASGITSPTWTTSSSAESSATASLTRAISKWYWQNWETPTEASAPLSGTA